ncbi:MAG: DNA translocase FtsK [Methylococcales bacterium]
MKHSLLIDDELYFKATELIKTQDYVGVSFLQRALKVGYNRAARLLEAMESQKIIEPSDSSGKRKVIKE